MNTLKNISTQPCDSRDSLECGIDIVLTSLDKQAPEQPVRVITSQQLDVVSFQVIFILWQPRKLALHSEAVIISMQTSHITSSFLWLYCMFDSVSRLCTFTCYDKCCDRQNLHLGGNRLNHTSTTKGNYWLLLFMNIITLKFKLRWYLRSS